MLTITSSLRGIYRDLLQQDGTVIFDSGWSSNTIVNRCRVLLAGFMKNEPSSGIQYLAVGQGLSDWDAAGAPAAIPETTTLVQPYTPTIPIDQLNVAYLDHNDAPTAEPTNRLQITATLLPGYPAPLAPRSTYPLREFGLFGRFGSSEYMINCIRHPVINKDAAATLIRMVRLYF